MDCPYSSVTQNEKICRLMEVQGLDAELDDFDLTHYCKGNPNHCFFFRSCNNRTHIARPSTETQLDVPLVSIMLNEPIEPDQSSSKESDKLFKLKRLLHRIA